MRRACLRVTLQARGVCACLRVCARSAWVCSRSECVTPPSVMCVCLFKRECEWECVGVNAHMLHMFV